jgi:hypothetical protein
MIAMLRNARVMNGSLFQKRWRVGALFFSTGRTKAGQVIAASHHDPGNPKL